MADDGADATDRGDELPARPLYNVPFSWDSSHGHMVELLTEHVPRGLVVDIGCGYAPHAERLVQRGYGFVGLDADQDSVDSLRARGFAAERVDANDVDGLRTALDQLVDAGEEITAVLALDVLEHLVSPHLTLDAVVTWMSERNVSTVGISLPNVSHQDVALKLLAGRFDLTPTGLLDHTHLRFFTDTSVGALTGRLGLAELARNDVQSPKSDQAWPELHPMLSDGALLGSHLRRVRALGDDHGTTFQFVRLYTRTGDSTSAPSLLAERREPLARGITVLVDESCGADDRSELEVQLGEQGAPVFSLTLPSGTDRAGAVRDVPTTHVVLMRGGERLSPTWAAAILDAADRFSGAVVRSASTDDSWASGFFPFDHLVADATPGAALAFPTVFLRDVSTEWNAAEPTTTHALLLEALTVCGVVDVDPARGGTLAVRSGWAASSAEVDSAVARLAAGPMLAPFGAAAEIARLRRSELDLIDARAELDRLHGEVAMLNAELARRPVRVARRVGTLANRLLRRN